MKKKIINLFGMTAVMAILQVSCDKKEEPAPANQNTQVSANQKQDAQEASESVSKVSNTRKKTSTVSTRIKATSGGRLSASGRMSQDTLTQQEITTLDNTFTQEFGADVKVYNSNDTIVVEMDYTAYGRSNPDANDLTGPRKYFGKMTFASFIYNGSFVTGVVYENYKEDYAVDSLDFEINGVIADLTGTNNIQSEIDLTIKQGTISTTIAGLTTLTSDLNSSTENGTYTITENGETFTYTATNVKLVFDQCDASFGYPTSGIATIKYVKANTTTPDETFTIDYGTGVCDTKAKLQVGAGKSEDFDLLKGA